MKYHVTIGERTIEVDLSGAEPRVEGRPLAADLATVPDTPIRHLRYDRSSRTLVARSADRRGTWLLGVDGRSLTVEVEDERTKVIRAMAGGTETAAPQVLRAPMPGMVVRILVEVGQSVQAGQGMIVVEAMKMENELKSTAEGTVASIEVAAGQAVDKGALLISFE